MKQHSNFRQHQVHQHEVDASAGMIDERLSMEAERRRAKAPGGLHGQIMDAVTARQETELAEVAAGGRWFFAFSLAAASLALFATLALWNPSDSVKQAVPVFAAPETAMFSGINLAEFMEPSRAEGPIHDAASLMFLAEYEKLNQDARSAGEFLRSAAMGRLAFE